MFFKKTPPPEYPASLDEKREVCPLFINISAFPFDTLSVERVEVDTLNEHTVVYCAKKDGNVEDYMFEISRKQHQELINNIKENV